MAPCIHSAQPRRAVGVGKIIATVLQHQHVRHNPHLMELWVVPAARPVVWLVPVAHPVPTPRVWLRQLPAKLLQAQAVQEPQAIRRLRLPVLHRAPVPVVIALTWLPTSGAVVLLRRFALKIIALPLSMAGLLIGPIQMAAL